VWINKKELIELDKAVKDYQQGKEPDIRDNREGVYSRLKDDIYALVRMKDEELLQTAKERDILSDYMADISHQLKTPITSMMIMADLLEESDDEKRGEFIRNIKFSLNKMEWLIGSLLKMAKLDSGAVRFMSGEVRLSDLMADVRSSVEVMLDVKDQRLEMGSDAILHCDRRWTAEALTNIVKNAMEHSPEGGTIRVDSGVNAMYEWISVTDSGNGLEQSQFASLFKRFENSTNENGFGIGMPLALSIMKGQNGTIDADLGGNGVGATFTLKILKN
jgi:signal transduction histidine kinase